MASHKEQQTFLETNKDSKFEAVFLAASARVCNSSECDLAPHLWLVTAGNTPTVTTCIRKHEPGAKRTTVYHHIHESWRPCIASV